jgi:hypothetical protein
MHQLETIFTFPILPLLSNMDFPTFSVDRSYWARPAQVQFTRILLLFPLILSPDLVNEDPRKTRIKNRRENQRDF